VAIAVALAVAVGASAAVARVAAGPGEGKAGKIAGVGVSTPQANGWDRGGFAGFQSMSKIVGAKGTWLSNISYDKAPQIFDRLGREGYSAVIAHSSGYEAAILEAAAKYPNTWWWVYSDLSSTKNLPNVAAVKVNWNQFGYMLGAIACTLSKSKKVGFVLAEPIPADTRSAGGAQDAAIKYCGGKKALLYSYIGSFEDTSKAKQAAEAMIAKGADVLFDVADAAALGAIEAAKSRPNVAYVGSVLDMHSAAPKEIATSVYLDFNSAYSSFAKLFAQKKLQAKIYPTDFKTGGIRVAKVMNVAKAGQVQAKIASIIAGIKSGKIVVNSTKEVKP
jgi:basic membrane protein A